jgi:Bax protein
MSVTTGILPNDGAFLRAIAYAVVFTLSLQSCNRSEIRRVETLHVRVDSIEQIIPITDSLVMPVLYTNVYGLEDLPMSEARQKFIDAMLPSILVAKHNIQMQRIRLMEICQREWSHDDSVFVADLRRRYHARNEDELLMKIGTLPTSIVLAQAAVESGWGRSRFFIQASNVFGIWSTDSTQARIPASRKRKNKIIYLRSYDDISGSVNDYFELISRSRSYRALRKIRRTTDDPVRLLPYLRLYSERKDAYTRLLKRMIEQNDLTRYDDFVIDPDYLIRE